MGRNRGLRLYPFTFDGGNCLSHRGQLAYTNLPERAGALPFAFSLVVSLLLMPIFAGLRRVPQVADIMIVWSTLVWCVVAVWPHDRWVAFAQVPYFVWVSIASALQLSITAMNL